jgi:UDP-N-acetylglucosamine 2-epimerase (non-hydrolysing)
MGVLHVVGARPNFMKVAPVYAALEKRGVRQTIVHTGQHYDEVMSDLFFRELEIPEPDVNLNVGSGSHSHQTGEVMKRIEPELIERQPERVFVYGDVNSTMAAALVCAKLLIPVDHVEAGLRSFDRRMPEEINRVVTDCLADLLYAPSQDGVDNLEREGVPRGRIKLVGNVMIDTVVRLLPRARARWPSVREKLELDRFLLLTLHRPSNVDGAERLLMILNALSEIDRAVSIVFPVHPRTAASLRRFGFDPPSTFKQIEPLGYLDFLVLQENASAIITDSGGVQEESTYLGIPCLTMRENTERPVTVEAGTNTIIGNDVGLLKSEIHEILEGRGKRGSCPPLWDGRAAERIAGEVRSLLTCN